MKKKKKLALIFFTVVLFFTTVGIGAALRTGATLRIGTGGEEIFEIRERMFIQQGNDIYLNPDEYLGRIVRLQGIYNEFDDNLGGEPTSYIYRNSLDCCGFDGMMGFAVLLDDGPMPEPNAWVEATGKVEIDENGYVFLRLSSLKVMDERGAEVVNN